MDKDRKDIKAIFWKAIEKTDPDERQIYLDEVLGSDDHAYAQVQELIEAHETANGFLEKPVLESEVTHGIAPVSEGAGTVIGRYKLLEQIGEGGMATVFMAEQTQPFHRRVALKIIKLGMDSAQVVNRFEAERQALALMDHPNIAKVYDAGTSDRGRPYFVMELVRGIPITEYCDKNRLSTKERLDLIISVCEAIQHAHQKGIIHRDIKPTNVLVSLHDGKPVVKVIDFGIAKAVNQRLTEKTLFTRFSQMVGTPQYMSPEQAEFSGLDVDTRTDIYSLGVLLYELLTGSTPFGGEELLSKGYAEMQRIIAEDEPEKPSTKLSVMGEALTDVAERRQASPDLLTRLLTGDLDLIVMKSIEKDRTRRYGTATELAEDIARHFNGEPVVARAPTASYTLRKFVCRHKVGVMAGILVVCALVAGLGLAILGFVRANRGLDRAVQSEAHAQEQRQEAETQRDAAKHERRLADAARQRESIVREFAERSLYVSRINLAEKYYRESHVRRTRELLMSCPEERRAWEWYYLWHVSDQAEVTIQGHDYPVYVMVWSPDGRRIASGGFDRTLKLWDADSGAEHLSLSGHKDYVLNAAFSPDNQRIVSCSNDHTLKLWDVNTGELLKTLTGHRQAVFCGAFSPDGTRIVSASRDKTLKLWDAKSGTELLTMRGHEQSVVYAAFEADGRRILSVTADGGFNLWDAHSGEILDRHQGSRENLLSLAVSPDGKRMVSSPRDEAVQGRLSLWNRGNETEPMLLRGHDHPVEALAFNPNGQRLVSGGRDRVLRLWDVSNGNMQRVFRGHEGYVMSAAFNPNGLEFASGDGQGVIKLWHPARHPESRVLEGHEQVVCAVAFSPDGRRVVSGSRDRMIRLWDARTGRCLRTLQGHKASVPTVAFSPDGRRIVSGSTERPKQGVLKIWNAETGAEEKTLDGHRGVILSVTYSPDGQKIASTGPEAIRLWEAHSGEEILTLPQERHRPRCVAFGPDGRRIVTSYYHPTASDTIKILDAGSGAELLILAGHGPDVRSVTFSPDGRTIASCSGPTVKIWDANSAAELLTLKGHEEPVRALAFSPDGRRLVTASLDRSLKVWDVDSGAELMTLLGHQNEVTAVAFSADGQRIVSGSSDNTLRLWEAPHPGNVTSGQAVPQIQVE